MLLFWGLAFPLWTSSDYLVSFYSVAILVCQVRVSPAGQLDVLSLLCIKTKRQIDLSDWKQRCKVIVAELYPKSSRFPFYLFSVSSNTRVQTLPGNTVIRYERPFRNQCGRVQCVFLPKHHLLSLSSAILNILNQVFQGLKQQHMHTVVYFFKLNPTAVCLKQKCNLLKYIFLDRLEKQWRNCQCEYSLRKCLTLMQRL